MHVHTIWLGAPLTIITVTSCDDFLIKTTYTFLPSYAGTCYSTSNIFGQNYELTSSQINDILGSHTTNSSNVYIILNDGAEFSGSLSREYQWYEELSVDFQSPIVDTPTSVWINKTPCKDCVELLEVTFKDRGRPTIYVESFDYNETDYAQLMKSIGCMAKLEKYNFVVKPWDWTLFSQILDTLNSANTCTASIRTVINSEEYKEKKADFEDFMDLYKELRDNHDLDEWCR